MYLHGLRLKKIPHTVHYCCSSLPTFWNKYIFTKLIVLKKTQCALIGQLSSAFWLAEYLKHVINRMLCPLPYLETHSISMT